MKRWLAVLLIGLAFLIGSYGAAETVQMAALIEDTIQTSGMIRVGLTSIGGKGTYNLTISGCYTFNGITLANGSKVKVEFSNGAVFVTANSTRYAMGSSATLSRQSGGVKIAESLAPSNIYPGDIRLVFSNGKACIVCYLYVEDYLYGVLPYEMDNSFPLEALKAQAVTARTYAMQAKTTAGIYDVTDTTSHQVFRGVDSGKARCAQAVNETWGIVLKYNGKFVNTYYSASNGGQTETNDHVWGGSRSPYFSTVEDPFDTMNPQALKKSYLVYRTPQFGSSISAYAMFRSALATKHGGSADQYTIEEITEMALHTPMYTVPSRLYTKLRVSIRYNGGKTTSVDISIFPTVEKSLALDINSGRNELYTVDVEDKGFRITARRYGHGVGMSQRGAQQMATSGLSYAQILGFYYLNTERVRMQLTTSWPQETNIPVMKETSTPQAVDAMSASAPVAAKVSLESGNLNLRKEPNDLSDILARIPNGEICYVLASDGAWSRVSYQDQTGYVSSMFLSTGVASDRQPVVTATVSLPNPAETLNLRQWPTMEAPVLALLPHNTKLEVLSSSVDWSNVSYQELSGYVMNSFIQTANVQAAQSIDPNPAIQSAATPGTQSATVVLQSGRLNVRKQPNQSSDILAKLDNKDRVEVLLSDDTWCAIMVNGEIGYVQQQYLAYDSFMQAAPVVQASAQMPAQATALDATGTAYINTTDGDRVNLRRSTSTNAVVLDRIPHGTSVEVLSYGQDWTKVRYKNYTGYVSTQFLTTVKNESTSVKAGAFVKDSESIWVNVSDGSALHLRKEPDQKATSQALIPNGTELTVLSTDGTWVKVIYKGLTGYVMEDFVSTTRIASASSNPQSLALSDPNPPAALPVQSASDTSPIIQPVQPAHVVGDMKTVLNTGKVRLSSPTAILYVKVAPDDLAEETGVIKHGAAVDILQYYETDVRWMYVRCGGVEGYVRSEHVVVS